VHLILLVPRENDATTNWELGCRCYQYSVVTLCRQDAATSFSSIITDTLCHLSNHWTLLNILPGAMQGVTISSYSSAVVRIELVMSAALHNCGACQLRRHTLSPSLVPTLLIWSSLLIVRFCSDHFVHTTRL